MMREEAEERAEGYETSAKTTAQPLAAGGMDIMNDISQLQGLSGILSMNAIDNVMSNLNDAQMMINPDRELPNPFNLRGDEDLGSGGGAEDIVIPKPPRKDKGKKRGQQNKTKEKILMGMEDELSRYNESIDWSGDSIAL